VITKILKSRELAELTAQCADSRKAEQITLIELAGFSEITDWFVICEGDNIAHNRAIADAIIEGLKKMRISAWHVEGLAEGRWIVLDYSDVVVHIMLPNVREYYLLDELWPKAKALRLQFNGDGSHGR
jgi:ribosome-associated protein